MLCHISVLVIHCTYALYFGNIFSNWKWETLQTVFGLVRVQNLGGRFHECQKKDQASSFLFVNSTDF